MKKRTLNLRLSEELRLRVESEATRQKLSLTEYITRALESELCGGHRVERVEKVVATDEEKRETLDAAKNLNDLLQSAIMARMREDREFLNGLSNAEFAKLVASRLPKENVGDPEAERELLSLEEWLGTLPGESDVTAELSRVKGELARVTLERDANLALLRRKDEGGGLEDFMEAVYRMVVVYVDDYVTRNDFPGIGDGGGLSDAGMNAIARRVKSDLASLQLHRTGVEHA